MLAANLIKRGGVVAIGVIGLIGFFIIASSRTPSLKMNSKLTLEQGDVIVQKVDGRWKAIKILVVDAWPDGTKTAHCLNYRQLEEKPSVESLKKAEVLIWHAPIAATSFEVGWERIGNQTVTEAELVGFVEYLKQTDFVRYAAFTGIDPKEIIRLANKHYLTGNELCSQGKRQEGISEYDTAIELVPTFFEAIDNRAFTYMELGQWREALNDFDQSLRVNPQGVTAFFSKGECLMKLNDLTAAEAIFQEGLSRFPKQREDFSRFLGIVRELRKKS